MTDKNEERIKQLAEALHEAATTPAAPEGASGLIGGTYLWGFVASKLITLIEEIARETVEEYLHPTEKKK